MLSLPSERSTCSQTSPGRVLKRLTLPFFAAAPIRRTVLRWVLPRPFIIDFSGEKYSCILRREFAKTLAFRTIGHKRLTLVFTLESRYTLDLADKIAHSGSHIETRGFTPCAAAQGICLLPHHQEESRRKRGCVNSFVRLPILRFLRSAHRASLFCTARGICSRRTAHVKKSPAIQAQRCKNCYFSWIHVFCIDSVGLFNNQRIVFLQNSSAMIFTHLSIPSAPLSSVR